MSPLNFSILYSKHYVWTQNYIQANNICFETWTINGELLYWTISYIINCNYSLNRMENLHDYVKNISMFELVHSFALSVLIYLITYLFNWWINGSLFFFNNSSSARAMIVVKLLRYTFTLRQKAYPSNEMQLYDSLVIK